MSAARGHLHAFSLLEVMAAIAIMAIALVVLFQVEARSIRLADHARQLTTAVGLARSKLLDCKQAMLKHGFSIGDFQQEGKFDNKAFEIYRWECHGYRFDLPIPDANKLSDGMKDGGESLGMKGLDLSAGMIAPFFNMIAQPINDSIRELVTTIRWKKGDYEDEIKVVTHVVDIGPLNMILSAIPGDNKQQEDKKKDDEETGEQR